MDIKRVKYVDVMSAVSEVLYEHFDDEVPILDVIKDHPRPAFFTRLDIENTGRFMTRHIDDDIAVRIYFYPSTMDNNEIELLDMQNELQYLFLVKLKSILPIYNGINIEINDVGTGVVDDVLHYYLFMTLSQGIVDTSKGDSMGDLELDHRVVNRHPADIYNEEKE